jgi:hypothetical protein
VSAAAHAEPPFRWRLWQVLLWAIGIAAALAAAVVLAAALLSGDSTDAVLWISVALWSMLLGGAVGAVMAALALILRALARSAPVALLRWLLGGASGLATSAALVWATGAAGEPLRVLVAVAAGLATGWAAQQITFARRRGAAAA